MVRQCEKTSWVRFWVSESEEKMVQIWRRGGKEHNAERIISNVMLCVKGRERWNISCFQAGTRKKREFPQVSVWPGEERRRKEEENEMHREWLWKNKKFLPRPQADGRYILSQIGCRKETTRYREQKKRGAKQRVQFLGEGISCSTCAFCPAFPSNFKKKRERFLSQ